MAKPKKENQTSIPTSASSTNSRLVSYIRSGKSGIYVVSYEEARVEAELKRIAADLSWKLNIWSITQGIINVTDNPPTAISETEDPRAMLAAFDKLPEKSMLVARDFHVLLKGEQLDPVLVRMVKDSLSSAQTQNKALIIVGCRLHIVAELEKEMAVLEFSLPDRAQLKVVAEGIAKSAGLDIGDNGKMEKLIDAASGLTTTEASDAFSIAFIETGDMTPAIVAREKSATVRKQGILDIVETDLSLDDIGGLELYKEHIWSIRNCFTKAAREYGLPSPRPVICCGQPGTGKSMSAMAYKNVFGLPLLRLEAGRLFGSLVGESEGNWRSAFGTAKAIAPCIIWIDEAEALFGGLQSSGKTDGGTTSRVIKAILQDMQFNSDGVMFVFTSNDIDQFPDPLIDRCDVWSFDLPTRKERESIWKLHIEKRKRKPDAFDIQHHAESTEGYSGRQIEQVWCKAMTAAFNDDVREPADKDIEDALHFFVPTSVTMKDAIERRRERLKDRARAASKAEVKAVSTVRKLA